MAQSGLIAALDIGCSKVSCLIAEREGKTVGRVRGMGLRLNEGLQNGALVNADLAEDAVRAAVGQAEKMAGASVDHIWLSLSSGAPVSHMVDVDLPLDGQPVTEGDVEVAMDTAMIRFDDSAQPPVHAFPAAYRLGDTISANPPIDLYGKNLTVYAHVITAEQSAQQNLETVLRASHLQPAGFVVQPLASGLGCLVADELRVGAACLDIGSGTTGIGLFANGTLAHSEVLPYGSDVVVKAISGHFVTTMGEAARLLAVHGSALHDPSDGRQKIDARVLDSAGGERETQLLRRDLTLIIEDGFRAYLQDLAETLSGLGFDPRAGQRLVLTGGAAQLARLPELARQCFGTGVRIGLPAVLDGLPVSARGPGFSTTVGLLTYGADASRFIHVQKHLKSGEKSGLGRLWSWIKGSI